MITAWLDCLPRAQRHRKGPTMQYCGLDLGKMSSHFCIMDKKRRVQKRGQVRTRISDLTKSFGRMQSMRIVLEASTKAFWVADQLEEMGHDVVVVDPGRTKAIGAASIKHDKLDAQVLAELCAADLLATVDRPTKEQRMTAYFNNQDGRQHHQPSPQHTEQEDFDRKEGLMDSIRLLSLRYGQNSH